MKNIGISVVSLLLVVLFFGCNNANSDCREDMGVQLGVSFFQSLYNPQKQIFETKEYTPRIWIKGIGSDSVICDSLSIKTVFLPLHLSKNVSSYALDNISTGIKDTLFINHTQEEKLVSLECGCKMQYTLQDFRITTHGLDSVIIKSNTVNNNTEVQMHMFFKK